MPTRLMRPHLKQRKFPGFLPVFQRNIDNPYACQTYTRCPICRAPVFSCDDGLYCGRCGWDNFPEEPAPAPVLEPEE